MRFLLAAGLCSVAVVFACGGESNKATDDDGASGEAGEPSAGGGGVGGSSTGGSGQAGNPASGGAPSGGAPQGGAPTGGTATGGGPPTGGASGSAGAPSECTPQDAAFTGACEPIPSKVWTGVACVEMLGCACVGSDCDSLYPTVFDQPLPEPPTCESAHAHCANLPRSCAELVAVYNEYASRDACEEDSDCRLAFGHCGGGIGGCYYFMNRQWPEGGLDTLAAEFEAQNCVGPVCSCAAPPSSVRCVDGRCAAGDP